MRGHEVGSFEMRIPEIGPFEMHLHEVGSFQNSAAKIQTPSVGKLAFPALLTALPDYRQSGGDIRCRGVAECLLLDGFNPKLFRPPNWPAGLPP
jgi:hypothetical protein